MIEDEVEEGPAEVERPSVAEPAQVKKQRLNKKLIEREDMRFLSEVMLGTKQGRRFLWRILDAAHTFEERFACGPNGFPQPEATWFHAGEQALGLRLYQTWLRASPDATAAMHKENDPRFS